MDTCIVFCLNVDFLSLLCLLTVSVFKNKECTWISQVCLILSFLHWFNNCYFTWLPRWCSGGESACQCRRCRRRRFDPWVEKIPWRRKWQATPVFLLGELHGQRSLAGYSWWDLTELDAAEHARVCFTRTPTFHNRGSPSLKMTP